MALNRSSKDEEVSIIRKICHDDTGNESRYKAFLSFYASITCNLSSQGNSITIDKSAFNSHDELLSAVDRLRADAAVTRAAFQDDAFQGVVKEEQERGAGVVSLVGFLTDCTTKDQHSEGYRIDKYLPMKWESSETYLNFLGRAFPVYTSSFSHHFSGKSKLKAWKLKKRYKLTLLPTSDLAQHLLYDSEARTIHIFHQVAFLKAQLRFIKTKGYDMNMNFEDSVNVYVHNPTIMGKFDSADNDTEAFYLLNCCSRRFTRSTTSYSLWITIKIHPSLSRS
jgi:hypothetical protein